MSFPIPSDISVKNALREYDEILFHKSGGFKAVYKGKRDEFIEAVKLNYLPKLTEPGITEEIIQGFRKRINREVNLLKNCNSPYIVKLSKLALKEIEIDGGNYAVYSEEFLEGENLFDLIRQGIKPDEKELKILTYCTLNAIIELWRVSQAIHRDIKVLNIIKSKDTTRQFILFDLGIAFTKLETPITIDPHQIPGTRQNLAPEMFDSNFRSSIDFRSDLYTLGITLYEYATGKHPLVTPGEDIYITISKILREIPTPIRGLRPDLSEDFANLIDQWLKKKPHLRPSNLDFIFKVLED